MNTSKKPSRPPPPRLPRPLPLTASVMPIACGPCLFVSCCERKERLGDNAQRTCRIVPDAERAAALWLAKLGVLA